MPTFQQYLKIKKDYDWLLIPASRIIVILGSILALFEAVLHFGDAPRFAIQSAGMFAFNVVAYVVMKAMRKVRVITVKEAGGYGRIFWETFLAILMIFTIQMVIIIAVQATRFAVTNFEIYLFYVNAAIAEESLMRAFLVPMLDMIYRPFIKGYAMKIYAIALSNAAFFTVAHYVVYGNATILLLMVFCAGFGFAFFYMLTRNFFAIQIAHILNNLIFAGYTVTNSAFSEFVENPITQAIIIIVAVAMVICLLVYFDKKRGGRYNPWTHETEYSEFS